MSTGLSLFLPGRHRKAHPAELGRKPALSLDHAAVPAFHHSLSRTPAAAKRAVEILFRICRAAGERERSNDENGFLTTRRAAALPLYTFDRKAARLETIEPLA